MTRLNIILLFIVHALLFQNCISNNLIFRLSHTNTSEVLDNLNCRSIYHIDPYYICIDKSRKFSRYFIEEFKNNYTCVEDAYIDVGELRQTKFILNDPDTDQEWFYFADKNSINLLSHNLVPIWEKGINGSGVIVAVVDDGVDMSHSDLKDNFDSDTSYNFFDDTNNPDCQNESHGTKCIGLISAVANNNRCGVGAAFGAKFAALKVLTSSVSSILDSTEARAFQHKTDLISIFSMSWGPVDDGKAIGRPNLLASKALIQGALFGRNGLGSIYIYSSGNGGRNYDSCAFDGYLQRYETFVFGSMDTYGRMPPYAERCTALLASTLSNTDVFPENKIYTTIPPNRCGKFHSGTSVSAPMAAAFIALLLQVNPLLHRRNIERLIIQTAIQYDKHSIVNAAGYKYSLNFGFGLIDVHSLINQAKNFDELPNLKVCLFGPKEVYRSLSFGGNIQSILFFSACAIHSYNISSIEVAILTITIKVTRRNALRVQLTSPSGTEVPVLEPRHLDDSADGLISWDIKVMAFYGESPFGYWTLDVMTNYGISTQLVSWGLKIYGHNDGSRAIINQFWSARKRICDSLLSSQTHHRTLWCSISIPPSSSDFGVDTFAFVSSNSESGLFSISNIDRDFIIRMIIIMSIFLLLCLFTWIIFDTLSNHIKRQYTLI